MCKQDQAYKTGDPIFDMPLPNAKPSTAQKVRRKSKDFLEGFMDSGGMGAFEPQYSQSQFMPQFLNDPQDPGAGALTQSILAKILGQTGAY